VLVSAPIAVWSSDRVERLGRPRDLRLGRSLDRLSDPSTNPSSDPSTDPSM
jgi:hypothetical protein